jgi:hypothetical protein
MKSVLSSKKGTAQSLAIIFLVLGTIALISFSLVRFSWGVSVVKESFDSFSIFEEVYERVGFSERTLFYLGEEVVVREYEKLAQAGEYILNAKRFDLFPRYLVFSSVRREEDIEKKFREVLFPEMEKKRNELRTSLEVFDLDLSSQLSKGFFFNYSSEGIFLGVSNWITDKSLDGLRIRYLPSLEIPFYFSNLGLVSFEELYRIKEECKLKGSSEEIEKCFERELFNFDVKISELQKEGNKISLFQVDLSSKRKFFLDGKLRPVEFGFLVEV